MNSTPLKSTGKANGTCITRKVLNSADKQALLNGLANYSDDIFLYGAGLHANCIVNWYCIPHNIQWAGAVVDDAYYTEGMSIQGKPVYPITFLQGRARPFLVVVAMGGMMSAIERVQKAGLARMESIVTLDASSAFWENDDLTYERVMANKSVLDELGDFLADDLSREILIAFLNARISGHPEYVTKYCTRDQYFPTDLICLSDAEVVYDCGAYSGDTLEDFLAVSKGSFKRYIAVEPEVDNVSRLTAMVQARGLDRVEVVPKGLWNTEGVLAITSKGTCASISDSEQGAPIKVTTLDEIRRRQDGPCTLLKMDIEGAELRALRGGEQMIKRDVPRLAINVCHRPEDLMTIPQFILSICPDYKLYLRHHHPDFAAEMVLYAL
jgi:FkbM family methyltransferase